MEEFEFKIDQEQQLRLDKFLTEKLKSIKPEISRSKIQKLIENNCVFDENNNILNNFSQKITNLKIIKIKFIKEDKPKLIAKNIDFEIIFEDNDIIIVNKPSGLTVHPGAGNYENTLVNGLLFKKGKENLSSINDEFRPGIIHRLDKDTSGLMIVAKNDFAHQFLSQELQNRKIKRKYLAFIFGTLPEKKGKIDKNISRSRINRLKMTISNKSIDSKSGPKVRNAITNYEVKEIFGDNFSSLIQCNLETGRTHQIRVHMEYLKHSLIGDQVYNGCRKNLSKDYDEKIREFIFNFPRQALHSYQLEFIHPQNKKNMFFEIGLSQDLKELKSVLEKL